MKQYIYEVSEQSTDTRYFEIVSNRKLTEEEINDAMCMPDIRKEGDCETDNGITSTFKWTDYGDDAEIDIEGNLKEED